MPEEFWMFLDVYPLCISWNKNMEYHLTVILTAGNSENISASPFYDLCKEKLEMGCFFLALITLVALHNLLE